MPNNLGFGIDVGGSGVKGAIVDLDTGQLVGERLRLDTPQPSTPTAVAQTVAAIVQEFQWTGEVGITLPAVVKNDIVGTAANIDPSWIGTNAHDLFTQALDRDDVVVMNDVDAAGIAEMTFGAGKGLQGQVLLLAFGTGIGSALFYQGALIPHTELGHCEVNGEDAEIHASAAARVREDLTWKQWAGNVTEVLRTIERFLWPDLIIVGGGISRKFEKWVPLLDVRTPIVPAELRNEAGIVGAAHTAQSVLKSGDSLLSDSIS